MVGKEGRKKDKEGLNLISKHRAETHMKRGNRLHWTPDYSQNTTYSLPEVKCLWIANRPG